MSKIAVISSSELGLGFQFTGVEVSIIPEVELAKQKFFEIFTKETYALIVLEEKIYKHFSTLERKKVSDQPFPMFIALSFDIHEVKAKLEKRKAEEQSTKNYVQELQSLLDER